ncbi:hypothetical protein FN846DRAFT_960398 [Sphaerosporella brunnea]|uniref:Uncharacterized protein n=1 Tax=Sphaerosporella brunnea TaxID=1250544 RepID=A0A5J5EQR8_9PEZI|nr:hypothetical protein FN846DRAFT_960398 [Sphaerosporella brunnea]
MADNCTAVVNTNGDITGIGVTVAFLAQVAICAAVLVPIRFLRVWRPKTSEDVLRFLEPVLTAATDVLSLTCIAHIIAAMYTFDNLSFDQVRHVLSLHWPAASLFLVSTGILWRNMSHHYARLAMQSMCIACVFTIAIRTTLSTRLNAQMECIKKLLIDQGQETSNFSTMFKVSVLLFPCLTLVFWFWTLLAVYVAQRQDGLSMSGLRRTLNMYADMALLFVPVAIVMVVVNIAQTRKRLKPFKDSQDNEWSFGQIFSLLMIGATLFEVYKGYNDYRMWKKNNPDGVDYQTVVATTDKGTPPTSPQIA